jgi:hypothetical protein
MCVTPLKSCYVPPEDSLEQASWRPEKPEKTKVSSLDAAKRADFEGFSAAKQGITRRITPFLALSVTVKRSVDGATMCSVHVAECQGWAFQRS